MLDYIEFLNLPTKIGVSLVVVFLILQVIGESLEFKGKVAPEFMKIRKYFARKRKERATLEELPTTLKEVKVLLNDVGKHYNADNISMRDKWIESVDYRFERNDKLIQEIDKKLDKNNADTLSILIDNKRNTIINFAACVIDENYSVTREQFNRIFKLYEEYEDIISKNGLTNGEVDIAFRIITESYEKHMKNHSFIEDIRGYDNSI